MPGLHSPIRGRVYSAWQKCSPRSFEWHLSFKGWRNKSVLSILLLVLELKFSYYIFQSSGWGVCAIVGGGKMPINFHLGHKWKKWEHFSFSNFKSCRKQRVLTFLIFCPGAKIRPFQLFKLRIWRMCQHRMEKLSILNANLTHIKSNSK